MTPVQQKVLTELPSTSSDCLVQAKTGTGKTIAFLLPALHSLLSSKALQRGQVGILIVSPTRELALQIAKECDQLTAKLPTRIECHTAFGGTARASNLNKFMNGNPTVLVATPGRLNDYLSEEHMSDKFADLRTLILDEADTMLGQGFLPDIKRMLAKLPPKKQGWQGMCFSATIPATVKDVISHVLKPGYTHLSTIDESEPPTIAKVPQFHVVIPRIKDVFNALLALVQAEYNQNPTDFKTIIFGTTANGVALLAALFETLLPGLQVYQLQSRLSQAIRTRTTDAFKAASSGLMFASDVIGRGMDFPNVGLVIQVGLPANGEQYVHRVGRTARAGNDGRAVILLTEQEAYFPRVNKQLPIQPYPVKLDSQTASAAPQVSSALGAVDETTKSKAYQAFLGFNKSYMKNLRLDAEGLVRMANEYADAMGCSEPPMVDKKTVGKMGLKGVKGLRVGTVVPEGNTSGRGNSNRGRSGGAGGGRAQERPKAQDGTVGGRGPGAAGVRGEHGAANGGGRPKRRGGGNSGSGNARPAKRSTRGS